MINFYNDYQKIASPDYIELAWNRKWTSAGDFSLYMRAEDFAQIQTMEQSLFVGVPGRPELGKVEKVVYEEKLEGHMVTLSGRMTEAMFDTQLDEYCYINKEIDLYQAMAYASMNYRSPRLYCESLTGQTIPADYSKQLSEVIHEKIKPASLRISWGVNEYGSIIGEAKIKTGTDKRDTVYFGEAWGDVTKIEYINDISGVAKRVIAVFPVPEEVANDVYDSMYKGETEIKCLTRSATSNHNAGKIHIFEPTLDLPQLTKENFGELKYEIENQLQKAAELELLNHYKIETINVEVLQNKFIYGKDYDLGDICTVVIDDLKQSYSVRIIEVRELHKENHTDIELVLGTPTKIKYKEVIV